jgi:hypothetical protein
MKDGNQNTGRVSIQFVDDPPDRDRNSFFDSDNTEFAPPKENANHKKKAWKRKVIGWCFILLIIVAGVFALYILLRVKRVDVRVQADSQRTSQTAKVEPSPKNSEGGLSAEAINIAREAVGPDATTVLNTASANASPSPSPIAAQHAQRTLSYTDNSPAYAASSDPGRGDSNPPQSNPGSTPQMPNDSSASLQSHANPTQTFFIEDAPLKPVSTPEITKLNSTLIEKKTDSIKRSSKTVSPAAVLPVFGTMLPVRTRGVIFTLRNNSYARLELVRDCQGEGWSLAKGTLLVGRVNGSEHDRAFINVFGYIDPGTNRLVKMTGEIVGSDGGSGMQGKRIAVDRKRLKQTLGKVASSGLQVAGMMAGALTGRGTVVVNGAGSRVLNPITDEAGQLVNGADDKRSFVRIEAGQPAYVMVSDLPNEIEGVDAVVQDVLASSSNSLTDREVMELILFGTSEDIRLASPLMNEDQKRMVLKSVVPEKSWP